jgi:hypothetical protein
MSPWRVEIISNEYRDYYILVVHNKPVKCTRLLRDEEKKKYYISRAKTASNRDRATLSWLEQHELLEKHWLGRSLHGIYAVGEDFVRAMELIHSLYQQDVGWAVYRRLINDDDAMSSPSAFLERYAREFLEWVRASCRGRADDDAGPHPLRLVFTPTKVFLQVKDTLRSLSKGELLQCLCSWLPADRVTPCPRWRWGAECAFGITVEEKRTTAPLRCPPIPCPLWEGSVSDEACEAIDFLFAAEESVSVRERVLRAARSARSPREFLAAFIAGALGDAP